MKWYFQTEADIPRSRNCKYAIDGDDEKEKGQKQCDQCRRIHAELDEKYCGGRVTGGVGLAPKVAKEEVKEEDINAEALEPGQGGNLIETILENRS